MPIESSSQEPVQESIEESIQKPVIEAEKKFRLQRLKSIPRRILGRSPTKADKGAAVAPTQVSVIESHAQQADTVPLRPALTDREIRKSQYEEQQRAFQYLETQTPPDKSLLISAADADEVESIRLALKTEQDQKGEERAEMFHAQDALLRLLREHGLQDDKILAMLISVDGDLGSGVDAEKYPLFKKDKQGRYALSLAGLSYRLGHVKDTLRHNQAILSPNVYLERVNVFDPKDNVASIDRLTNNYNWNREFDLMEVTQYQEHPQRKLLVLPGKRYAENKCLLKGRIEPVEVPIAERQGYATTFSDFLVPLDSLQVETDDRPQARKNEHDGRKGYVNSSGPNLQENEYFSVRTRLDLARPLDDKKEPYPANRFELDDKAAMLSRRRLLRGTAQLVTGVGILAGLSQIPKLEQAPVEAPEVYVKPESDFVLKEKERVKIYDRLMSNLYDDSDHIEWALNNMGVKLEDLLAIAENNKDSRIDAFRKILAALPVNEPDQSPDAGSQKAPVFVRNFLTPVADRALLAAMLVDGCSEKVTDNYDDIQEELLLSTTLDSLKVFKSKMALLATKSKQHTTHPMTEEARGKIRDDAIKSASKILNATYEQEVKDIYNNEMLLEPDGFGSDPPHDEGFNYVQIMGRMLEKQFMDYYRNSHNITGDIRNNHIWYGMNQEDIPAYHLRYNTHRYRMESVGLYKDQLPADVQVAVVKELPGWKTDAYGAPVTPNFAQS